jgi:DNA modification methylase
VTADDWLDRCHFGDVRTVLRRMKRAGVKVNAIVTSPPYWGLRKYLPDGHPSQKYELGHEPTLRQFIKAMADVFDLARDVLADDGTCWVNMGDSYATDHIPAHSFRRDRLPVGQRKRDITGFKDKDLLMQPHRLAIELQDRGWWVRQDIVWNKPNPLPETAKDRPTRAHEYVFQLAKSERYYFNFEAFREPVTGGSHPRRKKVNGWAEGAGVSHSAVDHNRPVVGGNGVDWSYRAGVLPGEKRAGRGRVTVSDWQERDTAKDYEAGRGRVRKGPPGDRDYARVRAVGADAALVETTAMRNRRSVWEIPTEPFEGSHYATYPRELVRRCLIGGCPPGGVVLDPFMGSGTTAEVAVALGMRWVGIDLDERNAQLQTQRLTLLHRIRQQSLDIGEPESPPTVIEEQGPEEGCRTTPTLFAGQEPHDQGEPIGPDACYFTACGARDAAAAGIHPARAETGPREEVGGER